MLYKLLLELQTAHISKSFPDFMIINYIHVAAFPFYLFELLYIGSEPKYKGSGKLFNCSTSISVHIHTLVELVYTGNNYFSDKIVNAYTYMHGQEELWPQYQSEDLEE